MQRTTKDRLNRIPYALPITFTNIPGQDTRGLGRFISTPLLEFVFSGTLFCRNNPTEKSYYGRKGLLL